MYIDIMNILLIKDDSQIFDKLNTTIISGNDTLIIGERPGDDTEEYITQFLRDVKDNNVDTVLSLRYYSVLSLACGALQIKYLCWLINNEEDSIYDYSIVNDWNYLFVADICIYNYIKALKPNNTCFLPLYCDDDIVPTYTVYSTNESNRINNGDRANDVLLICEASYENCSINETMPLLKDSSKGYIDGILEHMKSFYGVDSVFDNLPDYVKEDVLSNYPIKQQDFDTVANVYDRRYFFPIIDDSYSIACLFRMLLDWNKYSIDIVTDGYVGERFGSERVRYLINQKDRALSEILPHEKATDDYSEETISINSYSVVVWLPHRKKSTIIPMEYISAIAKGTLFLLPEYSCISQYPGCPIITFRTRRDLEYTLNRFFANPSQFDEVRKKAAEWAIEQGSINERFGQIVDSIR